MPCCEHNTATTRGSAPDHEVYLFQKRLHDFLCRKRIKKLLRSKLGGLGLNCRKEIHPWNYNYFNYLIVITILTTRIFVAKNILHYPL